MTLDVQFQTMVSMVLMGVWIGASIDTYHRFIKQHRKFNWMTAINDFVFWVIQGLIVFYILLLVNEGELRFYIVLALLCGFAAYQSLFQKFFIHLLERLIYITISIYRFFSKIIQIFIINPIKGLLKLLRTLGMILLSSLLAIFLFLLKVIYIPTEWLALKLYKLFRLDKLTERIINHRFVKKVGRLWKRLFKRDNKGD